MDSISSGMHEFYFLTKNNCRIDDSFYIEPSTKMNPNVELEIWPCLTGPDTLIVHIQGGKGPYFYKRASENWKQDSIFLFDNSQNTTLTIMDQDSCIVEFSEFIPPRIDMFEIDSKISDPDCGGSNGTFYLNWSGGKGELKINNGRENYYIPNTIYGLSDSTYTFYISDQYFCHDSVTINLKSDCNIYVPNSFSPNGDGINDYFECFSNIEAQATISNYAIYDRWGNKVYQNKDFKLKINSPDWWDGSFNGKLMPADVYVYFIDVIFDNGQNFHLQGEVNLLY